MTLRELEKQIREELEDGIAQIIIYKENKSWKYAVINPEDYDDKGTYEVYDYDYADVKKALNTDKNAIIINGYNDLLDLATVEVRLAKIVNYYECGCGLLSSYNFINLNEEAEQIEEQAEQVTDEEEADNKFIISVDFLSGEKGYYSRLFKCIRCDSSDFAFEYVQFVNSLYCRCKSCGNRFTLNFKYTDEYKKNILRW